jgi:hypothetical protein
MSLNINVATTAVTIPTISGDFYPDLDPELFLYSCIQGLEFDINLTFSASQTIPGGGPEGSDIDVPVNITNISSSLIGYTGVNFTVVSSNPTAYTIKAKGTLNGVFENESYTLVLPTNDPTQGFPTVTVPVYGLPTYLAPIVWQLPGLTVGGRGPLSTSLSFLLPPGVTANGYSNNDILTIRAPTGGTNATVSITTDASGSITNFNVTNPGANLDPTTVPFSRMSITNSTGGAASGNNTVNYILAISGTIIFWKLLSNVYSFLITVTGGTQDTYLMSQYVYWDWDTQLANFRTVVDNGEI